MGQICPNLSQSCQTCRGKWVGVNVLPPKFHLPLKRGKLEQIEETYICMCANCIHAWQIFTHPSKHPKRANLLGANRRGKTFALGYIFTPCIQTWPWLFHVQIVRRTNLVSRGQSSITQVWSVAMTKPTMDDTSAWAPCGCAMAAGPALEFWGPLSKLKIVGLLP